MHGQSHCSRTRTQLPVAVGSTLLLVAVLVLGAASLHAQDAGVDFGPYIFTAGPTFETLDPEFPTPTDMTYRIAFDLAAGSTSAGELNQGLNSVARFLNMHGEAGVPREQLQVAVVIHGTAAKDFLDAPAFLEFTGFDNPNLDLIEELAEFGVQFVMCGQSLGSRSVPREDLVAPVQVALSAMTAHLVLQDQGYRINPF